MREKTGGEPECLGDEPQDRVWYTERNKRPLNPAYERRVIKIAPVQAHCVISIVRLVDREGQKDSERDMNR